MTGDAAPRAASARRAARVRPAAATRSAGPATGAKRVVSLVPSVTEAIAAFGAADRLVGVTDWCEVGAPAHAARVGGTKSPSVAKVLALRPDLVIANAEENREEDLARLREAGVEVVVQFPRTVADVPPSLRELGALVGHAAEAEPYAADVERAMAALTAPTAPAGQLATLTLIWRKPWMAVGPDTYADDLLARCGFRNVLRAAAERYPRLDDLAGLDDPDVVLLPSEPYVFGEHDLPAVRGLVGEQARIEFVDGQLLTWHGVRAARALDAFRALARKLGDAQ